MASSWLLSSSSDKAALAVVDGLGRFATHGPHYSRRTPGSKTFTGIGRDVVLLAVDGTAVWSVVYQRTPQRVGSGASRGRAAATDTNPRHIWRNNVFRNLGGGLSSSLIREALAMTYEIWAQRYGALPAERLRTEVDTKRIRSTNPGYCYKVAGWVPDRVVGGKLYLWAPERAVATEDA